MQREDSPASKPPLTLQLASYAWVALLTLLIASPWLPPGYVFGTDFAGPRHFSFPTFPDSTAPLELVLAVASVVLPSDLVGKLLIFAILAGAGSAAVHAVPSSAFTPRAVAAAIYVINPFVYDRVAYGQLTVLAGYAALPWVALRLRRLFEKPTMTNAALLAVAFAVIAALDVHMAIVAALLTTTIATAYIAITARTLRHFLEIAGSLLAATLLAVASSLYWIVPLLVGKGEEALTLANIGSADLEFFSTAPDPRLGLLPNVLGLYGFWAERTDRFTSMKDFVPQWPLVLGALLGLACVGAVMAATRSARLQRPDLRPWVIGILAATLMAVVLEIGVSDPHTAPLARWLFQAVAPYRGMRDASKWGAVLALAYSQLGALGAIALHDIVRARVVRLNMQDVAVGTLVAVLMALPLYYGNGLLYGMHGQVRPSTYPSGWYEVDHALTSDPKPGRAVFLPWHGYLLLSFVRNANRVVASPAPQFFSTPLVASRDVEIPGIAPPTNDPDQAAISALVVKGGGADWGTQLASRQFKYVILAREADYARYSYLDTQPGLTLVGDYGSIRLYRNLRWT